ncbi:MAG: hypothetical protein RBT49_18435 [Bacteroidales bacterium]|jgi:uncharacterized tellurite resistance protein B-like protein|nr:hypothetical protein [Bacteroidales bacterium]
MGVQELFESYDKRKRKSHFKNLLAVALADGKMENVEFDFILHLAEKCYMLEKEVKRVIEHPEAITFVQPQTKREKFDQLYDLVTVMLIDGEISDKEMTLCKTFAMRMGYRTQVIDDLIALVVQNVIKGVAAEVALAEVSHAF